MPIIKASDLAQPSPEMQGMPPDDGRNDIQRSFDGNTKTDPKEPLLETGLKSVVGAIGAPFVHPLKMAETATPRNNAERILGPAAVFGRTLWDAGKGAVDDYKEGGLPYAATKAGGNIVGGMALGEGLEAGMGASAEIPKKISNFRPSPDPSIVPPVQMAAEKLAGSIVPKAKQIPGFVNDLQRNAGNIRDFVKESGNPLRTQAEFEKAVQGAGDKRYQHFTENILAPNAEQPIPVSETFGGTRNGPNTATLGEVHKRIGRINELTSPAYGKANPGDVAAALAKTPMEALQAEHGELVPAFHQALSEATGISPEAIAELRKDFGSLRGLGNTITEARAGRIGKMGSASEGSSLPASKMGILDKAWTTLHGGQDAMANRAFQKGWSAIEPHAGDGRPLPQSPEGFHEERSAKMSANQDAARAEATRMHELEQSSQMSAANRGNTARFLRDSNVDLQKGIANQEFSKSNELEQAAQDAAAQRAQRVSGFRDSREKLGLAERKLEGESARTIGREKALKGGR